MAFNLLAPYNIINITVTTETSIVTYEIPPCYFNGVAWEDTAEDDYEHPELKQAINSTLSYWTQDVKEAYKADFLKTYVPRPQHSLSPLKYYEIETILDTLIAADQSNADST